MQGAIGRYDIFTMASQLFLHKCLDLTYPVFYT